MKKRKIKLFASVASLAMVAAVMGVGVWAATTQSVNVTSTVQFSATGIEATVTLDTITGTAATAALLGSNDFYGESTAQTICEITTATKNTDNLTDKEIAVTLHDISDDGFFGQADTDEASEAIVYTFTITNDSASIPMYVNVSSADDQANTDWSVEFAVVPPQEGQPIALKTGAIAPGGEISVTCTFEYTGVDQEKITSGNMPTITIDMQNKTIS